MSNPAPPRTPATSAPAEHPAPTALQIPEGNADPGRKKKRNHRGGKKKRARKQSFAVSTEDGSEMPEISYRRGPPESAVRNSFYRLQGRNLSSTSIESEALLDHR